MVGQGIHCLQVLSQRLALTFEDWWSAFTETLATSVTSVWNTELTTSQESSSEYRNLLSPEMAPGCDIRGGEGQLRMVARACNSITQEALTGGLLEFEANLRSIERHYF